MRGPCRPMARRAACGILGPYDLPVYGVVVVVASYDLRWPELGAGGSSITTSSPEDALR
jgi:hypothetical protein